MMKITQEMRDGTGVPAEFEKAKQAAALGIEKTTDFSTGTESNIEKTKPQSNTVGPNEDISPEGLLNVISLEWNNEMERII